MYYVILGHKESQLERGGERETHTQRGRGRGRGKRREREREIC